jgi:hypothetical protein
MRRLSLLFIVLSVACGGSGGSASSSSTSGGEAVGNASVRARLTSLPAPPIPWSTRLSALTLEQATAMCPYADANVGTTPIEATCPDGSTVSVGGAVCDPSRAATMAQQVGSECALNMGEYVACQIALRQQPCDGGLLGGNLPECETFAACIAAALQEAQAASSPQ